MIRILHVIGAMDRGGAETMIMNLYRAIDRTIVQFDFMVHEERTCDYDAEIEALGGRIYRAPRFTGLNGIAYKREFRRFFGEHGEHPIVHGHIGSSAALYLSEAKRAGRYTVAHSHAQNFPVDPAQLAFRAISYPTRFIADYFMACSLEAGKDRFGQAVVAGDRFKVLKNGLDLNLYSCDEATHVVAKNALGLTGSPAIGHIGRLVPEKNHAFLLDVFDLVRREVSDVRLICAGRGPLEATLKQRVEELGLGDAVTFLGVREDVPELLKAFDVFILPSVKEGLSIAAIEAQAAGLPTLLSTGVPQGAVLTDTAERIALADGPRVWAERCVRELRNLPERHDRTAEIRNSGFDIIDSAQWLTDFYGSSAR